MSVHYGIVERHDRRETAWNALIGALWILAAVLFVAVLWSTFA